MIQICHKDHLFIYFRTSFLMRRRKKHRQKWITKHVKIDIFWCDITKKKIVCSSSCLYVSLSRAFQLTLTWSKTSVICHASKYSKLCILKASFVDETMQIMILVEFNDRKKWFSGVFQFFFCWITTMTTKMLSCVRRI